VAASGGGEAPVLWHLPEASLWRTCPLCAAPLTWRELDGLPRRACAACGFVFWAYPWPSVVGVVRDPAGRILVTRRRYPPEPGGICLPGGHMEMGEDPETAVRREVAEETGVATASPELLTIRATSRKTGLVMFFALAAAAGMPRPGSDALEAMFLPAAEVPPLCFETHREVFRRFVAPGH
jgi:8-oxo-dGTP diphosphatase